MAKGHIVQALVGNDTAAQYQFMSEHDAPFAAVDRPLYAGMGGEDQRQVRIGAVNAVQNRLRNPIFYGHEQIVMRHAGRFFTGHQLAAGYPGHGDDLGWKLQIVRSPKMDAIGDMNGGDSESREFLQGVGSSRSGRDVMIADQQQCGDACPG